MTVSAPPAISYQHRPRVRCLRAMAFAPYPDVPAALNNPTFVVPPPDEPAMMLFNGTSSLALNLVAAFIWDRLDGASRLDDVVSAVVGAFGVDRQTARQDVEALCEAFAQHNLVAVRQR